MTDSRRALWTFGLLSLSLFWAGCGGGDEKKPGKGDPGTASSESTSSETKNPAAGESGEAEVLLEPYDPPSLAELDAKAEWVDQPLGDTLKMLREKQAKEKPLATAAESLALKNTTKETNDKIVSALGRAATDDSQVDYEATINRHIRGEVRSTNPILASSVYESDVLGLTGFGMFSFDWNLEPLGVAESMTSWQTSKDRLLDKVVLRDDLTWSDGQPITAHDVVFSFQTIMNPKVPVPAQRSGTDKLRWVHAYDDRTVVFFHKESLATNIWNLNFSIIPKHIYEKSVQEDPTLRDSAYHVKLEENPICGGAYTITKHVHSQEIVLTRRDSYYMHNGKQVRDKPYFKEIRFRIMTDPNIALLALKNGELDEMELSAEQWTTQTNDDEFYERNTKASGLEWTNYQFVWNLKVPFFSDVRVRQAMGYAFNHKEMLDKLFYNLYEPANGMFHRTAWMAPKTPTPPMAQDLDRAERLLDEAGWEDHDGDGIRDKEIDGKFVKFEFSILCVNVPERVKLCTLLKENLAQIGILCNIRPTEFAVLQEKMQNKEFQASFGGWGAGADPDTSENIWGTGQMRNYNSYSNPEVDKLFEQGRKEFDRKKRGEIYARIHELTYADQPYTWLYYRNSFYAFNKKLRGYNFSPRGPYHYGPGFGSIYKVND